MLKLPKFRQLLRVKTISRSFSHTVHEKNEIGDKINQDFYVPSSSWREKKLKSEVEYHPEPIVASNCPSCGVKFQTNSPSKVGFIPKIDSKIVKDTEDVTNLSPKTIVCQRCFSIDKYNKLLPLTVPYPEFEKLLLEEKERGDDNVMFVKIVDLFNFSGSVIPNFPNIIGKKKVSQIHVFQTPLIIFSKCDYVFCMNEGNSIS